METVFEMLQVIDRAVGNDELSLNEWEASFIESIRERANKGWELSEKQDAKLTQIWERAMG